MNLTDAPQLNRLAAIEAEQSVLGAILINNDAIDRIGDLKEDHFFNHEHRLIFREMLRLIHSSKTADVITVFDALKAHGRDADLPYLTSLHTNTLSAANVGRYAAIVREKAINRALIAACDETINQVQGGADTAPALVDQLTSKLEQLAQSDVKDEPILAADDLVHCVELIDAQYHGTAPLAISTGFRDIDKKLNGGLRGGGLYVVAARPKMGKSAFSQGLGNNMARNGHTVLICSMEMPKMELHQRNISSIGKIPLDRVMDARQMTDADWPRLTHAIQVLRDMPMYFDDRAGLRLMQVRTKAKQIKRKANLKVMIIDYLQLMEGDGDNRNAQIEGITRGLKNLAKELDIAIVLLSQLNRKVEERTNKRPTPGDLRDSGSIEQDADVVMFLYRDEVYNPDSMDRGICEVNIALNRQGAPGTVPLVYIGENVRFEDYARGGDWHPPVPKTQPASRGFD